MWQAVKCVKCQAGAASSLIYSRLCESMQNAGPGLQLLIYYGAATAVDRSEGSSQEGSSNGPEWGPAQCLTKA